MLSLSSVDALGFVASAMTLVAFAQRAMLPMRLAAIAANAFFIAYGVMGPYYPVLVLHLVLLPANVSRLAEQVGSSKNTLVDLWKEEANEVFHVRIRSSL